MLTNVNNVRKEKQKYCNDLILTQRQTLSIQLFVYGRIHPSKSDLKTAYERFKPAQILLELCREENTSHVLAIRKPIIISCVFIFISQFC